MNLRDLTEEQKESLIKVEYFLIHLIADIYVANDIFLHVENNSMDVIIQSEEDLNLQICSVVAACYRLQPVVKLSVSKNVPASAIPWKSFISKLERSIENERNKS